MNRPSLFEHAGGTPAFLALAEALHRLCLADPVLNHPFAQLRNPQHVERLAEYWAEVFGGPKSYSEGSGGHSAMLLIHAGQGAGAEFGTRFQACFLRAADEVGLPPDAPFRSALEEYIEWAVAEVMSYAPEGSSVPAELAMPHWGWSGLEPEPLRAS